MISGAVSHKYHRIYIYFEKCIFSRRQIDYGNSKIGSSYNIGDYATVYQNPESPNAKSSDPEWFTSEAAVYGNSKATFFIFGVILLINAGIVYSLFKPKKEESNFFKKNPLMGLIIVSSIR